MSSMIILLIALALLAIPPVLIMNLPPRWLALAAPAGVLAMYWLGHIMTEGDLGPAGILIMGFFSLIFSINAIALAFRLLRL